jgi:hypothetical protein
MKLTYTACLSAAVLAVSMARSNAEIAECHVYTFVSNDDDVICVETQNPDHDYVQFLLKSCELADVVLSPSKIAGTQVTVNGSNPFTIPEARPSRSETVQTAAADTCSVATPGSPYEITALPYDQTFNATAITNTGDYRGPGTHFSGPAGADAFWVFTPATSGTYSVIISADDSSMGIGIWQGTCTGPVVPPTDPPVSLTAVATYLDFTGGGTSALSVDLTASTTYYIVSEDHFTSTAPTELRLQVRLSPGADGDTIAGAIDLTTQSWDGGFTTEADTTNNADSFDHAISGSACLSGTNADPVAENDIWFRLPATVSGKNYRVETFAIGMSNSYAVLYSAASPASTIGDLTQIACNDDKSTGTKSPEPDSDFMSRIDFAGDPSKVFYLFIESYAVIGASGSPGPFSLQGADITSTTVGDWVSYH